MSGRVFMPQRPVVRVDGEWKDKYDLKPAEQFGRLVEVIPAGGIPRDMGAMMRMIERGLADFDSGDYLLAVGDPIAIAMASLVAGTRNGGSFTILKFDRLYGVYRPHEVSTGGR